MKSPLKWPGGKRWLVPHLKQVWEGNSFRRWVEPFCGGASVALGLEVQNALLNDNNTHLINFWVHVKDGLDVQWGWLDKIESAYYDHRNEFNRLLNSGGKRSLRQAQLFYYLNQTCFNGMVRFNGKGEFNVPRGSRKNIDYMDTADFAFYKRLLSGWEFTSSDFTDVSLYQDDFVYVDPPYDGTLNMYSSNSFSWDDQRRLVAWLQEHTGPVIASNVASERICDLYEKAGFDIQFIWAPRKISGDGNRDEVKEILAFRNVELPVLKPRLL